MTTISSLMVGEATLALAATKGMATESENFLTSRKFAPDAASSTELLEDDLLD